MAMTMGNDSIQRLSTPFVDLSPLLIARSKVINSSPNINPKVGEEFFTINVQVKQEVAGAIFNTGAKRSSS